MAEILEQEKAIMAEKEQVKQAEIKEAAEKKDLAAKRAKSGYLNLVDRSVW